MKHAVETLIITVPFTIRKRGGRKLIEQPTGAVSVRQVADNTMVKALARAFRWKRMLESGEFATIGDLAAKEGIAPSYMTRIMRMTLLAPEIIEAIVEGRQEPEVTLTAIMEPFAAEWAGQNALAQPADVRL